MHIMDETTSWNNLLEDHPIFKHEGFDLAASLSTDAAARRQLLALKDSDLFLAVGTQIRVTSLSTRETTKSYKTLHIPNVQFPIRQISLNPNGKLLAVAGESQLAVIVLPRPGFMRLVPPTIDCKSIQVGQFYHALSTSPPIVKLEWHPWGDAGSTLLVMTLDGKLREYDISVDADEPQQTLSFSPEKRSKSYLAEDPADSEAVSFTLGKSAADWGALTVYALMRSGDVYAVCPYLPKNAAVPSAYIHALECFIAAKQEFLSSTALSVSTSVSVADSRTLETVYDHQRKYVSALVKQLPPGTVFPAASRTVLIHPPTTFKLSVTRQGPFLLQPAPRTLEGSEGGDATDIVYLAAKTGLEDEDTEDSGKGDRLGVLLIAYADGKVDVCLDVERVEARWDGKLNRSTDLPVVAVFESINLGLLPSINQTPSGIAANCMAFQVDPIHEHAVHVYHAYGVHLLNLDALLESLANALRSDEEDILERTLQSGEGTVVRSLLDTFSITEKNPRQVLGIAIPNDVYLSYSIFILTESLRITCLPLSLEDTVQPPTISSLSISTSQNHNASSISAAPNAPTSLSVSFPKSASSASTIIPTGGSSISHALITTTKTTGPPAYVSLLTSEPYQIPESLSGNKLAHALMLPPSGRDKKEFMLTPQTLQFLGSTVERFRAQIRAVQLAHYEAEARAELQQQEVQRQIEKTSEVVRRLERLRKLSSSATNAGGWERIEVVKEKQAELLKRLDRLLQRMMARASPELSEHETKWFEELKRMKREIMGTGKYDEESLATRASLLEKEYERIMPSLKELSRQESEKARKLAETQGGAISLGVRQAFELGEKSNSKGAKIAELEKKVLKMASQLDISVGSAPSQRREDAS